MTLRPRQSFTMIEMMVALSILSFMLVSLAQVAGLASRAFHLGHDRVDNFTKSRAMLDLLANDLQRAVFRGDLPIFGTGAPAASATATPNGPYYFTATTFTNAFYTRMPGVGGAGAQMRDLSLVSYALSTGALGADKAALERSDLPVSWTGAQKVSFQGDLGPLLQGATVREVAPGVVGFRLAFRRADGTLIDQSQYAGYDAANPVVAVDIGLTVIADKCLNRLSAQQVQDIQNALAQASLGFTSVKSSWDQETLNATFYANYPKALGLGEGLKTFERWVACPPF